MIDPWQSPLVGFSLPWPQNTDKSWIIKCQKVGVFHPLSIWIWRIWRTHLFFVGRKQSFRSNAWLIQNTTTKLGNAWKRWGVGAEAWNRRLHQCQGAALRVTSLSTYTIYVYVYIHLYTVDVYTSIYICLYIYICIHTSIQGESHHIKVGL